MTNVIENSYKNSGIEWIGDIPHNWNVVRLKDVMYNSIAGEVIDKSYWNCGEELLYTCQKIPMLSNYDTFPERKRTTENDLLLTRNATPYVFDPKVGAIYSNVVQKITIKDGYDKRYIKYSIQLGVNEETVNGDTIPSYNMKIWDNIHICNIAYEEQRRIADYLDNKCQGIDRIIDTENNIIKNLKEYKQTIITESVTKGLNKSASLKDSKIEYIGNIPENWNLKRLRYIATCQNGISKGGEFFGSGSPFVSYGDVYNNDVLPENVSGLCLVTDSEKENYSVHANDIFFTRTSETIEEIAITCVCKKTIEDATFAGFLIRVRPYTDELLVDFSKYYFASDIHRKFFVKEMNLVTRASLSQELLKRLPVLIPPKEEQEQIAEYLDKKCSKINKAISYKEQIIEKLTEYKKSLIYECVTGKKRVLN